MNERNCTYLKLVPNFVLCKFLLHLRREEGGEGVTDALFDNVSFLFNDRVAGVVSGRI